VETDSLVHARIQVGKVADFLPGGEGPAKAIWLSRGCSEELFTETMEG
jgi:hypothetical protein